MTLAVTSVRKIEIITFFAIAILLALFIRSWVLEREARIRAEASAQANAKIVAARQDDIKNRDAANAQAIAALTRQASAIQTPQQAAQVILHYLPVPPAAAPQVPIPTVVRSQLSTAVQAQLPDAPSYAILTADQAKAQAKADLACQATGDNLTTCQKDLADKQAELDAETATAQAWESAAKGGTKLQRFVHVLKLVGCGSLAAGAGAIADKRHAAIAATAGAAAGVTVCSLF